MFGNEACDYDSDESEHQIRQASKPGLQSVTNDVDLEVIETVSRLSIVGN